MNRSSQNSGPIFPFSHPKVLQTAMPIGGIGAGCICLNGYGGLQDFSIRLRPHITARPDDNTHEDAAFALLHIKGEHPVTRLVEGPLPEGKIFDQGLQAQGYRHGGHEGLPRFRKSRFCSGYPFGRIALNDPKVPVEVEITGWNPFIPLDDVESGIPCVILEYRLRNTSRKRVKFGFSYHLSHLAVWGGIRNENSRNEVIPGKGVHFTNTEPDGAESYGSASLSVIGHKPKIKAAWPRGGWFDGISALWHEAEKGVFATNDGTTEAGHFGRNGASVLVDGELAPGAEMTIPVVITWHFPNSNMTDAGARTILESKDGRPKWRMFYASQWSDARKVAGHIHRGYKNLRERTVAFQRALLGSTLPTEVLDAVSANLAILKSPTVLRQENGNLWGWEGCFTDCGCCSGTCTHVWNYAQAFCHLFPQLERTLREQELERSMNEEGHVNFRAALPDGPATHDFHPAADGQLGGIMKLYRDWQISGDTGWMRQLYPLARRSLEYCIRTWDPERKGALSEPHHNTYDIEFWGPDGMCTSIYLGALCAISALAAELGHKEDAVSYLELAARAARLMEEKLFNGEYFQQHVQYRGLRDTSFVDLIEGRRPGVDTPAMIKLLRKEGPKYQYGNGCLSDGIIGTWMARIYGIELPLDSGMIRKNLRAIHRHNFRKDLSEHANCQRPGYAMGSEPGLLLCSWPLGGKPTLPFVYSDEVWTGIEYQVASHMISEGLVREGLQIVKAVRSRYDGAVRNPWNEYECGSYYARAMASYALLGSFSGFAYSAVTRTLSLAPKVSTLPFTSFFSTASGFGTLTLDASSLTVSVIEGRLDISRIAVTRETQKFDISTQTTILANSPKKFSLKKK